MTRNSEYPLCRHTRTNGRLCQAPALVTSAYCRHHQKAHRTHPKILSVGPGLSTQVLHPLRNAQSLLQATSMVLTGLASGRIHPKVAGRMLFALQMATDALAKS